MNPNESNLDPLTLQRLIDGELETEQVQEVLSQAQSAPNQWESIAVGFIENQAWQRALNSRFVEPVGTITSPVHNQNLDSAATANQSSATGPAPKPIRKSVSGNQTFATGRWWIMAASLLAAATIGYMTSQIQNRNLPTDFIAENDSSLYPDPVPPKLTTAGLTPEFHVEVPKGSDFVGFHGQSSGNQIPVYRVDNADQLKQFQAQRAISSAFPRSVVEQLSDSGYQIEQEIEFVSGQVDNQSFVVPLRTIRFIPGQ